MFSLICVLICFPLWLVERLDAPQWILFLSGGLLLLILFGSIPIVLIGTYRVRKKKLDNVFLPLGVIGDRYQFFFRQYNGRIKGKEVAIRFYRGPVLEIEVAGNTQANLVASQTRLTRLSNLIGQSPILIDNPVLGPVQIFTKDEGFAKKLVQQPDVAQHLLGLTAPQENFVYRHVIFRSGKLILMSAFSPRLFGFDLDPEAARSWVNTVIALTAIVDSIEPFAS
jgi:hypothetical protein